MNWISVEDKLPEACIEILAYGIPCCDTCQKLPGIHFCTFHIVRGFVFGEYDCELKTTHWMPLPESPENL